MRAGFLFCFLLSGLFAPAQAVSPALFYYPFVLRLQHSTFASQSCVLLRRDGGYHLERARGESMDVFEGALPPEQLAKVVVWLDDDSLRRLTQKDVMVPLFSRGNDQTQINIFREDHWQWLEFPDAESRKPVEASLGPLLAWLEDLRKLPARQLTEEAGRHNCLPPGEIKLKRRPSPEEPDIAATNPVSVTRNRASAEPSIPPLQPSYAMLFKKDIYDAGRADRTCLVVYTTGRYHAEKSSQAFNSKMTSKVYEGTVGAEGLAALRRVLDDPSLKNAQHGNLPPEYHATEITILFIPRVEGTQRLAFARNFAIQQGNRWIATYDDPGARTVDPVAQWVKAAFRQSKDHWLKNVPATNCSPR